MGARISERPFVLAGLLFLMKDRLHLVGVERKLKGTEGLNTDIKLDGISTLEQALALIMPHSSVLINNVILRLSKKALTNPLSFPFRKGEDRGISLDCCSRA